MTRLKQRFAQQFMHPRGPLGALAGMAMARKNRARIQWAVTEMAVRPGDRVLEIGCGPGVAIEQLTARSPRCQLLGLEPSAVMAGQCKRRNAAALATGQFVLRQMAAQDYAGQDGPFDLIFGINVFPFLPDPRAFILRAADWLTEGGRVIVVHQVPLASVAQEALDDRAAEMALWLEQAGLQLMRQLSVPGKPNPVLLVEAMRNLGVSAIS